MKKTIFVFFLLPFTIYFTYAQEDQMKKDWANLKKYTAENTAYLKQKNKNPIILFGDSITEFWKQNNPDLFENNNLMNRGISGQTSSQMLLRFRQDVINLKPSKVIILAGINDIAENTGPISVETIFGNIVSMVELAKSNHFKVVLCSVLPSNHLYWNPKINPVEKIAELNTKLKTYALVNHLNFIDYYSAMVDEHLGLDKNFSEDGVHPNTSGYKVMEQLLLKELEN
ncbi:GDSL-type esterase/lipase family protein [Flavobacterium aciduliphilum]|uniref:Lysophospholipase L1-like esterase n=1 Tax=Flavobacterium aciduliphilum TaxID=1101402 RepID=A0A328YJ99_9FLAO|nr:GDSL-type esterase/lipase family protein [Flavobacterium aciduliphilum]RAR70667.1 lysophospholipase L1-like esterase [Flavobacterium aciduliphilum]